MYLTNYTADKVKLAHTFVEHLRYNWRKLDDGAKEKLLKEISDLLNIQFTEQSFESKLDKIEPNEEYYKAIRRARVAAKRATR